MAHRMLLLILCRGLECETDNRVALSYYPPRNAYSLYGISVNSQEHMVQRGVK